MSSLLPSALGGHACLPCSCPALVAPRRPPPLPPPLPQNGGACTQYRSLSPQPSRSHRPAVVRPSFLRPSAPHLPASRPTATEGQHGDLPLVDGASQVPLRAVPCTPDMVSSALWSKLPAVLPAVCTTAALARTKKCWMLAGARLERGPPSFGGDG